ncbi:hypothetical protein PTSG_09318 [Salpingoeca rosetta]|uniref:PH domain-containing protein n=1 Tax=Salpingoeca rosetta (strain ATCC 50818 / BSB-021) TaxID=946362 RepID=F2UMA4_SALR5|nr:uncharacterized protein PTSG_09318 [Salpingoeca rosetta]EGD78253.1 hypothetical protein PTSG_09318 [Salpingoeca rosetta]|eukprot:XP_004989576.1 hypothetical protein PTSG_09318 [Salpingoeca rosetta]
MSEPRLLFSGFLTKRGHIRKNWKRRHFELTDDKQLRYFVVSSHRHEAGRLDLTRCTQVAPGGRCKISWYSGANPHLCFGVFTSNKSLYVFAQTKEDLEAWLQALRSVVPKGVPVTTAEEIALSWEGRRRWSAVPKTQDEDIMYRVTVFPNGKRAGGKVLELPTSFDKLRIVASDAMGFPVGAVFAPDGTQIKDIGFVNDDDVLVVSSGEPFRCPPDAVWQPRLIGAAAEGLEGLEGVESSDEADDEQDAEANLETMLQELEHEASGLKSRLEDGTALDTIFEGGDDDDDDDDGYDREDYDNMDLALDDPEDPYISLADIKAMRQMDDAPETAPGSRKASGSVDTGYMDVADTAATASHTTSGGTVDTGYMDVGEVRSESTVDTGYMDVADARSTGPADGGYAEISDVRAGNATSGDTGYMDVGEVRHGAPGDGGYAEVANVREEGYMQAGDMRSADSGGYAEVADVRPETDA